MEKTLKERVDDLYNEAMFNKEGIVTDYLLFNAVKTTFNLKKITLSDFLILKGTLQKVIKDKKIN